jgi:hypothetical protein
VEPEHTGEEESEGGKGQWGQERGGCGDAIA